MKKFVSIFLVLVSLLSFSVTTFASEGYIPKTVELVYDPATYTYIVPKGVDIYVGDTITFNYLDCNIVSKTDIDPLMVVSVVPANIDIYVNDDYVAKIWYRKSIPFSDSKYDTEVGCFRNKYYSLEKPGLITFRVSSWLINKKADYINESMTYVEIPHPAIIEFELKDPNIRLETEFYNFFGGIFTMISELAKTIVKYPLILVFVVLSLVGLGIGLFVRYKK